jgi:hypothetical protein
MRIFFLSLRQHGAPSPQKEKKKKSMEIIEKGNQNIHPWGWRRWRIV